MRQLYELSGGQRGEGGREERRDEADHVLY